MFEFSLNEHWRGARTTVIAITRNINNANQRIHRKWLVWLALFSIFAPTISIADALPGIKNDWMGIQIQELDQSLAESFGLSKPEGVLITRVVPDGHAAKAGFMRGDIILSFNGEKVDYSNRKTQYLGLTSQGKTVNSVVLRNGKRRTIEVAFTKQISFDGKLGATVVQLHPTELSSLQLNNGIRITDIEEGGSAANAGLFSGDIIVSFDLVNVSSIKQFEALLRSGYGERSIPVKIQRGPEIIYLSIVLKRKALPESQKNFLILKDDEDWVEVE